MNCLYLHGFASSVHSKKATFFAERLSERGLSLICPDLNEPDFSTLTVTRMIDRVRDVIEQLPPGPVTLIGSSLGAFVALHASSRPAPDGRPYASLVFLAPALDFGGNRMRHLGEDGVARWRRMNRLDVFHYGFGRIMPVHYELYEDARRYDSYAATSTVPTLIFQGRRDETVDPASVERFAHGRAGVELRLLDDDHQLFESLPAIWTETAAFLGIG